MPLTIEINHYYFELTRLESSEQNHKLFIGRELAPSMVVWGKENIIALRDLLNEAYPVCEHKYDFLQPAYCLICGE